MYKVIKDGYVIDILESPMFVKSNKNSKIVLCDLRLAYGVLSSDGESIYHIDGKPKFTVGTYDTIELHEISVEEYEELKEQLDSNVKIKESSIDNSYMNNSQKVLSYEKLQQDILKQVNAIKELDQQLNQTVEITELSLEDAKDFRQQENKQILKTFLDENPILWTDGSYYGVSEQDQSEMITDLTLYNLKHSTGQTDWKLEWHNKKKSCREFTLEEFYQLVNAIANFVYPYRKLQEYYKEKIYACESVDELLDLEFIYDSSKLSLISRKGVKHESIS
jgi:hypothetical protein